MLLINSGIMIELQLFIEGELMKSEPIGTGITEIERKHFQWVQLYGLNSITRHWEIVLNVPSKMGNGDPVKLPKKMFPYFQKQIKNQTNESDQTIESESEQHGHCRQCHFEWRSFKVIGDATR